MPDSLTTMFKNRVIVLILAILADKMAFSLTTTHCDADTMRHINVPITTTKREHRELQNNADIVNNQQLNENRLRHLEQAIVILKKVLHLQPKSKGFYHIGIYSKTKDKLIWTHLSYQEFSR